MNRFGRWLYLAALCQLLAGPLVLGGLAGIFRCWDRQTVPSGPMSDAPVEMRSSSQGAPESVTHGLRAGARSLLTDCSTDPARPAKPDPKPGPDGKGKLWLIDDPVAGTTLGLIAPPRQARTAWHNACHPSSGPAPPTPPPRGV